MKIIKDREPIFIEPRDLLIIPNKNYLIKQTKTYQKYEEADTIVLNDILYTITLEFYDNKFHVLVYSSKLKSMALGEYQSFWVDSDTDSPQAVEHDRTLGLARFIYDQIMNEVIEIARKNHEG